MLPVREAEGAGGADSSFCSPSSADVIFGNLNFATNLGNLEQQFTLMNDALDEWADRAPGEIDDDVDIVVDTIRGLTELFEDYDYNFIAIGRDAGDDPRFVALDSDEFAAAADRISEFCDFDVDLPSSGGSGGGGSTAPAGDSDSGGGGGFTAGQLPDDFPEELVPPDSEFGFVARITITLTVEFTSTATIGEIVAFYEEALGSPTVVTNESALWSIVEEDKFTTVNVTGTDGDLEIVVALVGE